MGLKRIGKKAFFKVLFSKFIKIQLFCSVTETMPLLNAYGRKGHGVRKDGDETVTGMITGWSRLRNKNAIFTVLKVHVK